MNQEAICIWNTKSTLGEGIVWCPTIQSLLWVDIVEKKLYCYKPSSEERYTWTLPETLTCVVPCKNGQYLGVFTSGIFTFNLTFGSKASISFDKKISSPPQESPNNRPNDGCVDYWGNLWFGTMDNGETHATGGFYRYQKQTGLSAYMSGIAITNGPITGPVASNKSTIFFTDTLAKTIYKASINSSGNITKPQKFYTLPYENGYPDGMAIDEHHNLWCCVWGKSCILQLSSSGKVMQEIKLPVSHVTKCAFANNGLYITTARKGLNEKQLKTEPLAGGLFYISTEIKSNNHFYFGH